MPFGQAGPLLGTHKRTLGELHVVTHEVLVPSPPNPVTQHTSPGLHDSASHETTY